MTQRRHHYERAFEQYLLDRRLPYLAVDEARRAILPDGARLAAHLPASDQGPERPLKIKSFDFVVYGSRRHLLVEIKGRKIVRRPRPAPNHSAETDPKPTTPGRLESWVTLDDVESLSSWQRLFGPGYAAVFVFLYWCDEQPPAALFQEIFPAHDRWYAVRAVTLDDYTAAMTTRSPRWRTVHLPTALFERLSHPFAPPPGQPVDNAFDFDPARLDDLPAPGEPTALRA